MEPLTATEKELLSFALYTTAMRIGPSFFGHVEKVIEKKLTTIMEPLTAIEKELLSFALYTTAMRIGPSCFGHVEKVIEKVGVVLEFEGYAKNWIEYAKHIKKREDRDN